MRFQTRLTSKGAEGRQSVRLMILAAGLSLIISQVVFGQCVVNPTRETTVGLKNASSHFLTFYIDGMNQGGVPSGDRSIDFIVMPGAHILRADATIGGETVSATRTTTIPAGHVCTWTVTDPPGVTVKIQPGSQNSLTRERPDFVTLTIPNW